jgi:hypothetical protein
LDQGYRPRALIVNFSELLLIGNPRDYATWWSILADGADRLELVWRARDPAMAVSLLVQELLPSWSIRNRVRTVLGLVGASPFDRRAGPDDLRVFERNWTLNQGAQVAPRGFVPIEGTQPQPYDGNSWRWSPHPAHRYYVEQFLTMAQCYRVPVFWVLTPAIASWRERSERAGTILSYRRFVRSYLSRFPGLTVLDGQRLTWDHWAFRDPIHLNRDGALRFSLAIAEAILLGPVDLGGESRWIDLDGSDHRPAAQLQDLLEDLEQSRLAIHDLDQCGKETEGPRW